MVSFVIISQIIVLTWGLWFTLVPELMSVYKTSGEYNFESMGYKCKLHYVYIKS